MKKISPLAPLALAAAAALSWAEAQASECLIGTEWVNDSRRATRGIGGPASDGGGLTNRNAVALRCGHWAGSLSLGMFTPELKQPVRGQRRALPDPLAFGLRALAHLEWQSAPQAVSSSGWGLFAGSQGNRYWGQRMQRGWHGTIGVAKPGWVNYQRTQALVGLSAFRTDHWGTMPLAFGLEGRLSTTVTAAVGTGTALARVEAELALQPQGSVRLPHSGLRGFGADVTPGTGVAIRPFAEAAGADPALKGGRFAPKRRALRAGVSAVSQIKLPNSGILVGGRLEWGQSLYLQAKKPEVFGGLSLTGAF